jgi:hypothetical protein
MGAVRLWIARLILPVFCLLFLKDMPELNRLFGRWALLKKIWAADVDGASAQYADRFKPSGS